MATKYVKAIDCADKISEAFGIPLHDLIDVFAEIPSADVAEVKHGEWECVNEHQNVWMCTGEYGCGNEVILLEGTPLDNEWNHCPKCGAKMEGGKHDN